MNDRPHDQSTQQTKHTHTHTHKQTNPRPWLYAALVFFVSVYGLSRLVFAASKLSKIAGWEVWSVTFALGNWLLISTLLWYFGTWSDATMLCQFSGSFIVWASMFWDYLGVTQMDRKDIRMKSGQVSQPDST